MDPLSHAVVGGTAAVVFCKSPKLIGFAALCGMVAGMAPDLDVLIRAADNPMLGLGFHRHFTHSLAFVPFGALIVAGVLHLFLKARLAFQDTYLFCFAGMSVHGLLDAMTNYGTHLFWPLTNRRESWSVISIIDPIFTVTIVLLLTTAIYKKMRRYAMIAACFAALYLSFGLYQREAATAAMTIQAQSRGHVVERFEVKPSIGNLFAWRGQYFFKNRIYVDGYHVSPWRGRVIYDGSSLPLYTLAADVSPLQQKDFEYFNFFSDGWVALAPQSSGLIGDIRFAMLPNSTAPIWGIRFNDDPMGHVFFENVRSREEGDLKKLWTMIKGQDL